jgi:multidrug efflux pump subunit AcrB
MEQIGLFAMIGAMAIMLVFGVMAGQYESFKIPSSTCSPYPS